MRDFLPDELTQNARVGVRKGTGTTYRRRRVSLIEGTNVAVTVADDPNNEEVDVTLAVVSAAPSGSAGGTLGGTYPNPTVNTDGSTLETNSNALRVKDGGVTQAKLASGYRATYNGTSAPSSPSEGDHWYDTTNNLLYIYSGAVWFCITPQSATVATGQATTSTSYTDLSTAGPAVTVLTGTAALVTLSAAMASDTVGAAGWMAVAVSSATTLAAADSRATRAVTAVANYGQALARTFKITGLTPGSNVFTAKYKTSAGTTTFADRDITVVAIPT